MKLKRHRSRRIIEPPGGTKQELRPWKTELTELQLALARGDRWLKKLETGEARSLRHVAEKEGVDNS